MIEDTGVLIETLWNVKLITVFSGSCHLIVLIETLWNVKMDHPGNCRKRRKVLIETLWNVKKGEKGEKGDPGEVLIETLWNVKPPSLTTLLTASLSINRNIMECKVHCFPIRRIRTRVLIETLWNVKIFAVNQIAVIQEVLIETLWNVKLSLVRSWRMWFSRINRNIMECKAENVIVKFPSVSY